MKKYSKYVARLTGATLVTTALLTTPSQPLFMNSKDPYRALRSPKTLPTKMASVARSLFSIEKARASSPDLAVPMNSLRSAVGFVMGYGSRQSYIDFACGGTDPGTGQECDGPPEQGLVGKMAVMLDAIPAGLESAGVASCDAIPTSGSAAITASGSSVTVTYATPTQSIPSAWDGGGTAFTKRLEFTSSVAGSSVKFAAEFACGTDGILMAINMAVGDHAPGYTRPINVWVGKKSGNRVADIHVAEVNGSSQVRGAYSYNLLVDETNSEYRLAGSAGVWFDGSSNKGVDRVHIHGNYSTNQASIFLNRGVTAQSGSGDTAYLNGSAFAALSGGSVATVGTGTSYALNTATGTSDGSAYTFQGCVDFDSPSTDPTSTDLCSGLALSDPDAPVIDSTGNFGSGWVVSTMHSKLVGLPSL